MARSRTHADFIFNAAKRLRLLKQYALKDVILPKRAAELREQGRRRRGRPRLRWEDCVKRDVKKTGEDGDWKKKTGDRGEWRRIADEAVKKLQAAPYP